MSRLCLKNTLPLLLACILCSVAGRGQSGGPYPFQQIDEGNGLSDNHVQCIFRDKNGFMWIGTASGLDLLDGSAITIFKNHPEDSTSLSDNFVNTITSDSSGHLWIGTRHGLDCFDPVLRKFTQLPLRGEGRTKNDGIISLATDSKNNLFIATGSGLFFYDRRDGKISFLEIPGDNYEKILNNNITHIGLDSAGVLWIATFNGLWSYGETSGRFVHEINASNDPHFTRLFTNFIFDHAGKLWIGTWNEGLKEFDPVTHRIITHRIKESAFNIYTLAEVRQPDGTYRIWVNGSSRFFSPDQNRFVVLPPALHPDGDSTATTLYTSPDNWLWVGSQNGLKFYNPSKDFIHHLRFAQPITGQGVSILQWGNKTLVSGAGKYFLKAYDSDWHEVADYGEKIPAREVACLSLRFTGNHGIRCGTSSGVEDIDLATHAVAFHRLPEDSGSSPTVNFITSLLKDRNGTWWLFPWRNGIWIADSSINNPRKLFNNFLSEYQVPKPVVISDACEDQNDNLWLSDYDEGIIFYDRRTGRFSKPFLSELGERNSATQIFFNRGHCYSFFGNTVLIWNVDSLKIRKMRLPSEVDKPITSLALDSSGHLWIATQSGLFAYNVSTGTYSHFTTADGLLSNDMNGTLYCRSDGTMIFGCPHFLSSFSPAEMLGSIDNIPPLELTGVSVDGVPVLFPASGKMRFSHTENNFTFKWAVIDYNDPLNNRYYYQLQGIDNSWRYVGKKGEVEFANLSPGEYTLLLKGENSNGRPAGRILTLHFTIRLPFWRTAWFLALLFGSVIALFYGLYRYRLNQVLKIEKLRNKISLDLHDDIGSTLSSISILSDMALHHESDSETAAMLAEIRENSISMMEGMDDIVWSINPGNDSLESLLLRIRSFAAKLFEAREINYKIHISENTRSVHLPMEYRQHIYLIMKEAINNLAKYAQCTEAEIGVTCHASLLSVCIRDNGKGFDVARTFQGNGLGSMKKRAAEMNACLEITSEIHGGTQVSLFVKIK